MRNPEQERRNDTNQVDLFPSLSLPALTSAIAKRTFIIEEPHFSWTSLPMRAYLPRLWDDGPISTALVLDVHPVKGEKEGLSSFAANRWFRRARQLLENHGDGDSSLLVVIHGYNGGTAWKRAISRHFPLPNIIFPTLNRGITVVECKAS